MHTHVCISDGQKNYFYGKSDVLSIKALVACLLSFGTLGDNVNSFYLGKSCGF